MSFRPSARFPEQLSHSALARFIAENGREDVIDLTSSNPTRTLQAYPHQEIAEAMGRVSDFTYEPDPFGALPARVQISALYADVSPDRVALTGSTSEAYSLLFKLLCNPGDEVLVPIPSYPLFEHLAAFENVRAASYPLRYDGAWHIDFAALEAARSERTRAIVVVNPNNPTGSFLKRGEAEQLLHWATRNAVPIISDEVFQDYRWSQSADVVASMTEFRDVVSFSLNGLSKSAGMPQMKLGWMVINGPEPFQKELELLLDTYLSVNWPVQLALPSLLRIGSDVAAQLRSTASDNLACARAALGGSPAHVLTCEGGWTAVVQLPRIRTEEEWVRRLLVEDRVLVQPGFFFDMPTEAFVVLSLITPPRAFAEGVHRLRTSCDRSA